MNEKPMNEGLDAQGMVIDGSLRPKCGFGSQATERRETCIALSYSQ
jgi:hypothetical protein